MGYMRHNAIVVTSWNSDLIEEAAGKARQLDMTVEGPSLAFRNGFRSMLVAPDGSKEGWVDSNQGDERRAAFRDWLRDQHYDDGSSSLEWVEIAYGNDDCRAEIVADGWTP